MAERKALVLRASDGVVEELPTGDTLAGTTGGGGIADAPSDGSKYARQDAAWVTVTDGADGNDGADGQGVPVGGTAGQVLKKVDATDYNTEWANESGGSGVPNGGTTGQVLAKASDTDGDVEWATVEGGSVGGATGGDKLGFAKYTPVADGTFSDSGDGGASLTNAYDSTNEQWVLEKAGNTTFSAAFADVTDTGDWERIFRIHSTITSDSTTNFGVTAKNTTADKSVAYVIHGSARNLLIQYRTTNGAFDSESTPSNVLANFSEINVLYFRIRRSGDDLYFAISPDGINWWEDHTPQDVASGYLAGDVDQVGIQLQTTGLNSSKVARMAIVGFDTEQQEWMVSGSGGGSGGQIVADETSYGNVGGMGDRTGIITTTGSPGLTANHSGLIDGSYGNSSYFTGSTTDGRDMVFGFDEPKAIDEITWRQSGSESHGNWKFQGSTDNLNWTDISSPFTLGGSAVSIYTMDLYDGGLYTYYRLYGVDGNPSSGPWLYEIEFKIAGGVLASAPELPIPQLGDAGKYAIVNPTETGYILTSGSTIVTENFNIVNHDFETGDETGWTVVGNAGAISRTVQTGGLITQEEGGDYVCEGGVNSASQIYQEFDITQYQNQSATYFAQANLMQTDAGTPDSVAIKLEIFDSGDNLLDSIEQRNATYNTNMLGLIQLDGQVTATKLRVSLDFLKGPAGSGINAYGDNVEASVTYNLEEADGIKHVESTAGNVDVSNLLLRGEVFLKMNNASANTVTIPAGLTGIQPLTIFQKGAGQTTLVAASGVTINSLDAKLAIAGQFGSATLVPDGIDNYNLIGALA